MIFSVDCRKLEAKLWMFFICCYFLFIFLGIWYNFKISPPKQTSIFLSLFLSHIFILIVIHWFCLTFVTYTSSLTSTIFSLQILSFCVCVYIHIFSVGTDAPYAQIILKCCKYLNLLVKSVLFKMLKSIWWTFRMVIKIKKKPFFFIWMDVNVKSEISYLLQE